MKARVLFVSIALSLATTSIAFGQTLDIATPTEGQHILLGHDAGTPDLTADTTLTFTYADGAVILIYIDEDPVVTLDPAAASYDVTLGVGAHTVAAYLADAGGTPFDTAESIDTVRLYVSRVCDADADCADDDPCTQGSCIGDASLGDAFYGRCRFGPVTGDTDCCVTSEWCRHAELLDVYGVPYVCQDVDADAVKDCVACVVDADCTLGNCDSAATCNADNSCQYTKIPDCCAVETEALDCNDGSPCTIDTCDAGTSNCVNTPVAECCIQGNEAQPTGASTYGCTPAGGSDPCLQYACIGIAENARCRTGPLYPDCCDADADCTNPQNLNACTDPDGVGYGQCDPFAGGPGVCAYPKIDPTCCVKNYECADQYPENIGTCKVVAGQDWKQCEYVPNDDYCEVPPDATIVINELMVNSGGPPGEKVPDFMGEWVEVFNPTAVDIDINGWTFSDAEPGEGADSITIDHPSGMFMVYAGGYRALGPSNWTTSNGNVTVGYVYDSNSFKMDNDADEVILKDDVGALVDEVDYSAGAASDWPTDPADNTIIVEGHSIALIHNSLDNNDGTNWRASSIGYGNLIPGTFDEYPNYGTPAAYNADVFDTSLDLGPLCDDSDACTIDICNYDKPNICAHLRLQGCCTAATALSACNDGNACTIDTCDDATNDCVHTAVESCCTTDRDCLDWYPDGIDTPEEIEAFDACAHKTCVGVSCRFGRKVDRPGCCIASDNDDFGCEDRNACTENACVPDGGVDPTGATYPKCTFDLDPTGDTINDCCRLPEDCEDNEPSTLDTCDMTESLGPDDPSPGVNYCWYKPDPNWCGDSPALCNDSNPCTEDYCCDGAGSPHAECTTDGKCVHIAIPDCCSSAQQCIDGQACTTDVCCFGAGAPYSECTAANVCAHHEAAGGCCESHADCNGDGVNPYFPCRTGYCIGTACRYGPFIDGCCLEPDDCDLYGVDVCAAWTCEGSSCVANPIANCCNTGADCPSSTTPCKANVCFEHSCTEIDIPNCCTDDNQAGPDASCNDDNPCTADYCMEQASGALQCRFFPTGGAGCCMTANMCPDDQVQCTTVSCDGNECALDPVADCISISAYEMSFTEGHPVFAGEYQTVADLGWTVFELGTNAAGDAFGFDSAGNLGPDKYLSFAPAATVADYESCVEVPEFRTYGFAHATVGFDYAASVTGGSATLRVLVKELGEWSAATEAWSAVISADTDATDVTVPIPGQYLDSEDTVVAICIAGTTTDGIDEVEIDRFVMAQGEAPDLAAPANQSVASGQTKTISDVFTIAEPDIDEAISLTVVNSPGTWLKIVNLHKTAEDAWTADLQLNGAVCPANAPFNYSLTIEADDGALIDAENFILVVEGCE